MPKRWPRLLHPTLFPRHRRRRPLYAPIHVSIRHTNIQPTPLSSIVDRGGRMRVQVSNRERGVAAKAGVLASHQESSMRTRTVVLAGAVRCCWCVVVWCWS